VTAPGRLAAWLGRPLETDVVQPISARRAYLEVLAVYCAFFAAGVVDAVLLVAGVSAPTAKTTWASAVPGSIKTLAEAGLAVAVVVLLCQRRHRGAVDLGLSPRVSASPRIAGVSRRDAWIGAVGLVVLGHLLFGAVDAALETGSYPYGTRNAAYLMEHLAQSINAGIVEETVVLAFVMVTLAQAKRPLWEIVGVAVILRGLFHVYYGPGALGAVVWVPLVMWVFWRGRSLFPLIIVHVVWDSNGFLHWYRPRSVVPPTVLLILVLTTCGALALLVKHHREWGLPASGPGGRSAGHEMGEA
jgi:hypothetical protein